MKYIFDNCTPCCKNLYYVGCAAMCYKSKAMLTYTYNLHTNYFPNSHSFLTFKLSYCGILPINCPSQEDFEYFDDDKNGILTWSELELKAKLTWTWFEKEEPRTMLWTMLIFCFYKFVSMLPYLYHVSFYINANKKLRPQYLCNYFCLTRICS